jgi:hypothetical protein
MQDVAEVVDYLQSFDLLWRGPIWTRLWFELEIEWSGEEPAFVTMPKSADKKLAEKARQSHEAFEFAKWIVSVRIRAGAEIPLLLAILVADWMDGTFKSPAKKRGPSRKKNWDRDFMFRYALDILDDRHEIPSTRNRELSPAASEERKETGYQTGVEIVQKVFRDKHIPVPGRERLENIVTDRAFIQDYDETRGLIIGSYFENLEPEPRI